MKKDLKVAPYLTPMMVQMIATYNEDGSVDCMNAAWGGILDYDLLVLSLDESHKTSDNIKRNKAFTLSLADLAHLKECDYLGMVSGKVKADKFAKAGFTASKSDKVNAPIINELPLALECEAEKISNDELGFLVYARIKGVKCEESVLDKDGHIDSTRLGSVGWNQIDSSYYEVGKKVGKGFALGKELLDK